MWISFLTVWGIQLEFVRKDWAAWVKDMDEFKFDMTCAAEVGPCQPHPMNYHGAHA